MAPIPKRLTSKDSRKRREKVPCNQIVVFFREREFCAETAFPISWTYHGVLYEKKSKYGAIFEGDSFSLGFISPTKKGNREQAFSFGECLLSRQRITRVLRKEEGTVLFERKESRKESAPNGSRRSRDLSGKGPF